MATRSLTTRAAAPCLSVIDGIVTTLSTHVAALFGKRHDHVLDTIRALLAQLTPEHHPNFREMLVDVAIGNGAYRQSPAYRLTRDGFTLLAMGFTGKRALQFKLAYIDAFNRMEGQLRQQQAAAGPKRFLVTVQPGQAPAMAELAADVQVATWPELIEQLRDPHCELPLLLAHDLARTAAWQAFRMSAVTSRGRGAQLADQLRREKLGLADLHELITAVTGEQAVRMREMAGQGLPVPLPRKP